MHLQFDPQSPKTRDPHWGASIYRTATDFERTQLKSQISESHRIEVSKFLVKWKIENRKWNEPLLAIPSSHSIQNTIDKHFAHYYPGNTAAHQQELIITGLFECVDLLAWS